MDSYLNPKNTIARIADAEENGYGLTPAEVAVVNVELAKAAVADRISAEVLRVDHRIDILRAEIKSHAFSINRQVQRAAENAIDGRGTTIGRGSVIGQFDEAVVELNALLTEREMLTYILEGAN